MALDKDFLSRLASPGNNYKVHVWNNANGLPHNTIYALEKDNHGFIWLATEEGLTRFDGSTIKVFDPSNTSELIETSFYNFYPASEKGIWAAGYYSLALVDKNIKQVVDCKPITEKTWISGFAEDKSGNLWIGTKDGKIHRYHQGKFELLNIWKNSEKDPISSLFALDDLILIGTDSGLFIFDQKKGTIREISDRPMIVTKIFQSGNRVLIGSSTVGLLELDSNLSLELVLDKSELGTIDYRSLRPDGQGRIWGGTESGEILLIENNQIKIFEFPEISGQSIRKVLMDGKHFLVGTQNKGLLVYKETLVKNFEHAFLNKKNIRPLYQAKDKSLWIGTRNDGVFRIKNGITTAFDASKDITHQGIVSLYGDEHHVYVGSREGLYRIGLESNDIVEDYHLSQGFPRYQISTIIRDQKGKIWFSTAQGGIYFIDKNNKIQQVNLPKIFEATNFISCSLLKNGDLAFGSIGSGLLILREGKILRHSKPNLLPAENIIYVVFEDEDGDLWLGTQGGLIYEKEGNSIGIQKEHGLIGNGVYSITPDNKENIWISSNFGIQKFPISELFRLKREGPDNFFLKSEIFNESHGMNNLETNSRISPSALVVDNGQIWIPTIEGISIINPENFHARKAKSIFYWDQIKIGNTFSNIEDRVSISPGNRNFSVIFSNIDYEDESQVSYFYRIKEISEEWIYLGKRNEIFFNFLPPKKYTLEVLKMVSGNREAIYTLDIKVLPYFYQTWWFKLLLVLFTLLIALFIIRYNFKSKMSKSLSFMVQKRTNELEESNNRLEEALKNIENQNKRLKEILWHQSHTIRGPLTRGMSILQILKNFEYYNDGEMDKDMLLDEVDNSLLELDQMVRKINDELHEQHQ